ncbi:MAG: Arm DNA-binding domain-containing protein [Clostridia bacterium]|nr:Arm DNA-binding domain-containing protein [Clostridia bacterium]
MKGVSTFSRTLKNGKISWGYRFDTAPIGNKRQQVSKSGYKSKKEALRAGMTALQQYETIGQVVSPSDMSFSDYLDLWVNEDCNVDLKPTTILNYQKKINNHIKPNLGAYRLRSIKKEDLQAFIIDKFDNGYSYNTLAFFNILVFVC